MKNGVAFIIFILIAPLISWGAEGLFNHLNQEYLWNIGERTIRWAYIIISCTIGFPIANYLSKKIEQLRK